MTRTMTPQPWPRVFLECCVVALLPACGGSSSGGPVCPPQTGAGTQHHGVIAADETWTAKAGPHIVDGDVQVNAGTLTIEPCAAVKVAKGVNITVGGGNADSPAAGFTAHGEVDKRILI